MNKILSVESPQTVVTQKQQQTSSNESSLPSVSSSNFKSLNFAQLERL